MIKFGTDGWRAIVGEDFNSDNVDKVLASVMHYVVSNFGYDKRILIGYDCRNQAPEFAKYSAKIFADNGFNVLLSDKIVPTPVIAYNAKHLNACALMFTASHNPPEYLGIKFIPDYGGPATTDITNQLTEFLNSPFRTSKSNKKVILQSFEEDYIEHLEKIIDFKLIADSKVAINYDGHHGAASSIMKFLLNKYSIKNTSIHLDRDINFGGFMPDPKEKYLPDLKNLCIVTKKVGVSNDGDGDRFGVFNENGQYVPAEDIIAILLLHLKQNKLYSGKIAKTVGSGSKLDIIAKHLNLDILLTPVGFKWLGQAMRDEDIIIAGEESGGLSIKGHIPEKDGILAVFLILEAMAYENKSLVELQKHLYSIYKREFYTDRIDFEFESDELKQRVLDKFNEFDKKSNFDVADKITIDGIKFILKNNNWILIRKSGTEPLLRVYFEADSLANLESLKKYVKEYVK